MTFKAISVPRDDRISAYFFDLDGTLLDTELVWVRTTAAYLRSQGKRITDDEAGKWVHGRAWHDIYRDIVDTWPDLDIGVDEMDLRLVPIYKELSATMDIEIKSSVALMKQVARHTPTAIVSGSPNRAILEAIAYMSAGDALRFYLGSSDYSPGKPDPACFLAAAERVGADPAACVVFEDSHAGVQAGLSAGMPVVALQREGATPQDVSAAHWILDDLARFSPDELFERIGG